MPKAKPKRRLKNIDVQFISLVDSAANKREVIFKAEGADSAENLTQKTVKIRKTDDDQHLVYGIVYAPDEVDAHLDTANAEDIQKACHAFLEKQRQYNVDKQHDEIATNGVIVESYIIKGADEMFPNDPVGAWAVVMKVTDEDVWNEIKDGKITGISMQANVVVESLEETSTEKAEVIFAELVKAKDDMKTFIKKLLGMNKDIISNSTFEKVMKSLEGKTEAELSVIMKDFKGALGSEEFRQAIYALTDSNWSVMQDEEVSDKKAALVKNAEQFIEHLNGLTVQKNNPNEETTMAEEPTKTTTKSEGGEESEELKAIKALTEKVDALGARVETVEKSAGTSQAAETEDEDPGTVQKSTGLKFI